MTSTEKLQFDPTQAGWVPRTGKNPFLELVGPIWQKQDAGQTIYGFLFEDKHNNSVKIVHGGAVATAIDHAMGAMCSDANPMQTVTVDLNIKFIGALRPGDFMEIRPTFVRSTRSMVFVQSIGTRNGEPVVSGSGMWKVIGTRPPKTD